MLIFLFGQPLNLSRGFEFCIVTCSVINPLIMKMDEKNYDHVAISKVRQSAFRSFWMCSKPRWCFSCHLYSIQFSVGKWIMVLCLRVIYPCRNYGVIMLIFCLLLAIRNNCSQWYAQCQPVWTSAKNYTENTFLNLKCRHTHTICMCVDTVWNGCGANMFLMSLGCIRHLICFCLNCVLMWMGDIKAVKIAFLINQPFLLIYFPYAQLPVCPHECFFSHSLWSCEEELLEKR